MHQRPVGEYEHRGSTDSGNKIGAPINIPNHYDMFASNSADPHLFADYIKGGFILEFNKPYHLTPNALVETTE